MKINGLSWVPFRIPLCATFATARGSLSYREGLVVRLATDAGVIGLGEASPLPAPGGRPLEEAVSVLERLGRAVVGLKVQEVGGFLETADEGGPAVTAVRCALDTAACDALAKAAGVSVASLLAGGGASRWVTVNAVVASPSTAEAQRAAAAAREEGFRCVKLKVGLASAIGGLEEERERVAAVRAALGPDVALRLDANGVWTVEEAVYTIRALEEYGLELVEQPVAPEDPEGMRRVAAAVRTPIAADESVAGVEAARRLLEMGAARVFVVKPMVVGGLRPARRIVELAGRAGAAAIVTTTLDAGVGTAAALHLAATLPPHGPACGLATGALLASDLIARPLEVRSGRMALPEGPGLGVALDEGELQHYGGVRGEVP